MKKIFSTQGCRFIRYLILAAGLILSGGFNSVQAAMTGNWYYDNNNGYGIAIGGITMTCSAQGAATPSTGYRSFTATAGVVYSISSNTPSGWGTPYISVYYDNAGTWTQLAGGTATGFNFTPTSGNLATSTTLYISVYNGNTSVTIGSYKGPATFPSTSATLTYQIVNPTQSSAGAGTYCAGSYNITNTPTNGTSYWQGTTSGGVSTGTAATSESVSASGTYYYNTDNGGCWSGTTAEAVTIYGTVSAALSGGSSAVCYNGTPATFTATGSGGNGSYTYLWYKNSASTGVATQTYSTGALTASCTVYCAVTSGSSCGTANTSTYAVAVDPAITVTPTPSATTTICPYSTTNALSAGAGGGTAGYTYVWSSSLGTGSTATPTSTTATTYTVTVTDSKSCTAVGSTGSVNVDPALSVSPTPSSATTLCSYSTSGALVANASGGSGSYSSYTWSNSLGSGATATPTLTTATSYTVTVTDSKSCTASGSTAAVTVNPAVTVSPTPSAATTYCNYANSNVLAAGAGGGTAGYTYNWSSSLGTGSTATPTSSTATTYTVTVTDSKGCTATGSTGAVTIDPAVTVAPTPSSATYICSYATSGALAAHAGGGSGTYSTYAWSNGLGSGSTATPTLTTATTYTVTVTDNKGCSASGSTGSITVDPAVTASPTPSSATTLCSYATTNALHANASGGTGSYTYSWSSSLGSGSTATPTITAATVYTVTVFDGQSCTATASTAAVGIDPAVTVSPSPSSATTLCYGTAIGAGAGGGTAGYTYAWSGGLSAVASPVPTSATATVYSVTVTDSKSCTVSGSTGAITVNPLVTASVSPNSTSAYCSYSNSGVLVATAGGGTAGYTYSWSSGLGTGSTATPTSSTSTVYTVTVTDTKGCTATASSGSISVDPAITLSPTPVSTKLYCSYATSGVLTAGASGGTAGYTYAWSNGLGSGSTATPSSSTATVYNVTVTDSKSCTASGSTGSVTVDPAVTATVTPNSTSSYCSYSNSGVLTVTAGGGTAGYSYAWSGGLGNSSTATPTSSTSTVYTVTVTDADACTVTASSGSISVDPALTVTPSPASATTLCSYATTGAIAAGAAGGTPSYTYSWNNGLGTGSNGTPTITSATVYSVTVTDSKGCSATGSTGAIGIDAVVTAAVTPTGTTTYCPYSTSGALVATAGGGTAGYTYAWSNGLGAGSTATPTSTSAIVYTVTVTDSKACSATANTGSVNVDPAMAVNPTPGSATLYCNYAANGVLAAGATGGTGTYSTYAWSGGLGSASTASPTSSTATAYSVTVTDSKGCTASGTTGSITVDPAVTASPTPNSTTLYCSYATSGVLAANAGGGTSGYTYLWSNSLGTGATATPSSSTATSYTVTVTDSHSCTVSASTGLITVDPAVTVSPTPSSTSLYCPYATSGVLAAGAGGGTAGYTYSWSNSLGTASTATPSLTTATTYTVTVTDSKGCTASGNTGSVSVDPAIVVSPTPSASPSYICSYSNTGALAANASGGTAGYTYLWSNGLGAASTATPTIATGTIYTVTVTDSKSCTASASTGTVYDYSPPTITATSPGAICGAGTVNLGATASAGTVNWWTTSAGGTPPSANTGPSFTTPIISTTTTYYVNATANGCTTQSTTAVVATVYPTSITSGGFYYSTVSGFTPPTQGTRVVSTNAVNAGIVTQATTGLLPCTTYYYVTYIVTNGDTLYATTPQGTFTTNTLNATISLTSAAGTNNQTACYGASITPITYAIGGGGTGGTATGLPTGITGNYSGGVFTISGSSTVPGTYNYTVNTTGTCTQTSANGTIIIENNFVPSLSGGSSPICYNTAPTTFTASGAGGSGSYTYQWYTGSGSIGGATASTYSPGNLTATTTYYCAVTSGTCGTINTSSYVVTVDGNLIAGLGGGSSPICYNTTPSTFTANGSGGTGSYTYQWYNSYTGIISGATSNTYSPGNLTATSTFYCAVTSGGCGTVNTGTYVVSVDGAMSAALSGGSSPICYNSAPLAFTTTASGGSGTYTYQWYTSAGSISGATASTYLPGNLSATTTYYCIASSSAGCGSATTSNYVVTVDASFTANLTGGSSPICYNTTPTTFTATGVGGTGSYTYQWYAGGSSVGGATASTYSPGNIASTTTYLCAVTSGSCGTVNTSSYTVNVDGALSAGISGGSSPICYNTTPASFTCTASGGSSSYTYQWYTGAGAIGGATASTYSPGNLTATTTFYCIATSGGGCGSATTSNFVVNVDAGFTASTSGGTSPVCYNTSPGTITASGSGGSGSYSYLWYINSSATGITTSTYAPGALTSTSTIYCAVTSGSCGTVNTTPVTITVDGNLSASLTGGSSPICYNNAPTTFTATATGGTGSYTYQWYTGSGSIGGATASTYSPGNITATTTYHCSVTSGACGTVSTSSYTVTVYPNLTASQSGGTSPICYNTAPGTLTASASGGTGTYTYLWYLNGSATSSTGSTYAPGALTSTSTIYCAVTSGTCGTVNATSTVITVDGNLTASQSGGSSPICYNTSPGTFTATASGGTGSYTYQWYNSYSGSISGATASTYAPGNLTATSTYYCAVSSGGCGTVNTGNNTITVYGNLTAVISGGTTPACYSSDPGTFTATGSGGTGSYTYQWYNSSGSISGATSSTYDPGTLTASNSYSCSVTSGGCGTVSTGPSAITVEPAVTSYGSVNASGGYTQTVCDNVAPNGGAPFTVTGAAGSSGSFTYQWYYQSGLVAAPTGSSTAGWTACGATQGTGYNTSSFSAAGSSSNITFACFVTPASPVCGTGQWAANDVQVTVLTSGPTESSSGGASVCIGGTVNLSSTLSVAIPATYQWYSSTNIGFTSPTTISGATSTTYSPSTSTAGTTYYEVVATFTGSGCSPATSNVQTVVVYATPTAAISGGSSPICYDSIPATLYATPSGGSGSFTYQWYKNGSSVSGATSSSYSAGNLTAISSYYCSVTDVAGCGSATTSTTTITVDGKLTVSLTGGTTPICYNTSPGTFTVTASGGTGSYTYQWFNGGGSISGATASTYAPGNITASNSYYCSVTSGGCGSVNTGIKNITVHANLTASASGGTSPICYNTAPGTLTAAGSGGTGTYTYQWYNSSGAIGGATSNTYAPGNLTASNTYTCSVTSGTCGTVSTNTISITVDAALSASIAGGTTPICNNTDPGTFTATGTGGTGSYTYQWYNSSGLISGATASTYDPGSITASDSYSCSVTSGSCGTVASNSIAITVEPGVTASISGGASPICYNGDPGAFTATGSGGTGTYTYQWYNGGGAISGATASTYDPGTLTISNSYHCAVTSGSCGTVNTSTTSITVDAALSASISGGTSPICNGTDPGAITATGTGGTGSYTYQWYNSTGLISGATASTYDPGSISASNTYSCSVTSGSCGTVTSNSVSISVDATVSASISGGSSPICNNTNPGTFTATGVGGTGSYTYQWYNTSGSISGATSSTYSPGSITSGNTYSCSVTSGSCGTAGSNSISIVVDGSLTASISGGTSPICYNAAPGTFTASVSGGSGSVTYQWYNTGGAISGATSSTYAPGNITTSNSYTLSVTDASCGTVSSNTISVTVDATLAASIAGGSSPICYNTAPGTFTANATGGTGTYTYQWYNTSGLVSGATASTYAPGSISASNTYSCSVTSGGCGTVATNSISIVVNSNLTASISGGTSPICYNTAPGTFTATGTGGTGSYTYQWYNGAGAISGATASTYAPGNITTGDTYSCSVTSGSCGTASSNTITIAVNGSFTASIAGGTTPICSNTSPGAFTATGSGGTGTYTYLWYNNLGSISGATASTYTPGAITATTTYYCAITSGSCGTVNTSNVVITVNALPTPTFSASPGSGICASTTVTYTTQTGQSNYIWTVPGTLGTDYTIISGGIGTASNTVSLQWLTSGSKTVTVNYTNGNGCTTTTAASTTTNVSVLNIYNVTGGSNCGVSTVALSGSDNGVSYQLYLNGISTGSPVSGTGSSISFGAQTTSGTYTVRATGCSTIDMNGSSTVYANPTVYTASGGSYCSADSVILSGSQVGVSYQLVLSSTTNIGSPVSGTGSPLDFGLVSTAGTYSVIATNANCSVRMTDSLTINGSLNTYNVSGVSLCSGLTVSLSGSDLGVDYQLKRNGSVNAGSPVTGNGSAVTFPVQTAAGTYTVLAYAGGCTQLMNDSAVTDTSSPTVYNVTGGTFCGSIVAGLSNSQVGFNYQLVLNGANVGSAVSGTGSAISFGSQYAVGTYTVNASNALTPCITAMNGSAQVVSSLTVVAPTITASPTTAVCQGTSVSATFSAGSGGVSTTKDTVDYSTNGGISWSAYTSGTAISTSSLSGNNVVQIRTWRFDPTNPCYVSPYNYYYWSVGSPSTAATSVTSSVGTVCSDAGTTLTFNISGGSLGANAKWELYDTDPTVGNPAPIGSTTGTSISVAQPSVAGTYTYYVRAESLSGTCATSAVSTSVTVTQSLDAYASGTTTACSGSAASIALASHVSGTTFSWTVGSITGGVTGATASSGNTITDVLTVASGTLGTVTYLVTPINASYSTCPAVTASIVVNVNSYVAMTSPTTASTCNSHFSYTPTSNIQGATYTWSRAAAAGITPATSTGTDSILNDSVTNTSGSPIVVTYTINISSSCGTATGSVNVTVNPQLGSGSPTIYVDRCGAGNLIRIDSLMGGNGLLPYTIYYTDVTYGVHYSDLVTSLPVSIVPPDLGTLYSVDSIEDYDNCKVHLGGTVTVPTPVLSTQDVTVPCNLTLGNPVTYYNSQVTGGTTNAGLISTITATTVSLDSTPVLLHVDTVTPVYNNQSFMKRNLHITPTTDSAATVTIYISQAEVDSLVVASANDPAPYQQLLPDLSNLVVSKYDGGAQSPTSHTAVKYLTPTSVTPNTPLPGVYAVTFNTTGFSGFFLNTKTPPSSVITGSKSNCSAVADTITVTLTGIGPWDMTYFNGYADTSVTGIMDSIYTFIVTPTVTSSYYVTALNDADFTAPANYLHDTAVITINSGPAVLYPTVATNPICVGSSTNIQVTGSTAGEVYQLQLSNGDSVGTSVTSTGGTVNLPTGTITGNMTYQVKATVTGGCSTTTPADINVVAVNPDIAFGVQLPGDHFSFGTISTPALPTGWNNPSNAHGNHWVLANAVPPGAGSYFYYNNLGDTVPASTGTYIQTPTGDSSSAPLVNLTTGTINATGYTNLSVQWAAQKSSGYTGTVSFYYSIDNGATYTQVAFTDVQANETGSPWSLVNNTVQIKLPAAADNASQLKLLWTANQSTDASYYSMNDIGIYGLNKIVNCGGDSVLLPYLNSSCNVSEYSLSAATTGAWPSSPAFNYVSGAAITSSPIKIQVPSSTTPGTYNLNIKVDDGASHYSSSIQFPVTTDLLSTATVALDNCSCNYTTTGGMGSAYGNIVTVYAAGGTGSGFYFNSGGTVDTLLSTVDASNVAYSGSAAHIGVKGIFWSKADGAVHNYSISDGYCTASVSQVTQSGAPTDIPFGTSTGQPTAITSSVGAGYGGGNGISGSFNNAGYGDNNITNVNGNALTCHQRGYFGNTWVTYQVNNMDHLGAPLSGDSTNNKAVVEINNNGTDLDSVEVSVYRDAYLPAVPNDLSAIACSGYTEYAMERHFMIKSTKSTGANAFANGVGVRLYFTDAEFQDLAYWTMHVAQQATGQTAGCAYGDTVTNINSIYVTKYTGANEDGNYGNNAAAPSGLYRVFGKNAAATGNGPLAAIDGGAGTLTTGGTTNLHYVQMNVTEFSEFWLGGSQGGGEALPVQMLYLEAEALNNDSIQVRWATAEEVNNHEFDVERSTDGNTWTTINITPGHNNSVVTEYYTFNDLNVTPGVVYYYRLKQVDNNGNYVYTGIVQAEITGQGAFTVMNFVPNPTTGNTQLTVVATKEQEITVDFYDMIGQKVLSSVEQVVAGTNRINFNLQRFAAGTYSAVVTSENQLYTKKIVVTK